MDNLVLRIRQEAPKMSKNYKKIAEYILHNMEECVELKATEIGIKSNTSSASVIRFAKSMGYSGLNEFKIAMVKELHTKKNNTFSTRIDVPIQVEDSLEEIGYKVEDLAKNSITDLFYQMDYVQLSAVIDKIEKAENVYLVGIGASSLAAYDLYHKLNRINKKTMFNFETHMMVEFLHYIKNEDVLIAFSYSGNSTEVIYPAEIAKERGASVVAITQAKKSKLSELANHVLTVPSNEDVIRVGAMNSRMNTMLVGDMIYLGLLQRNLGQVEEDLIRTNELTQKFKYR